jgi:hypothetical protein
MHGGELGMREGSSRDPGDGDMSPVGGRHAGVLGCTWGRGPSQAWHVQVLSRDDKNNS